MPLRLKEQLCLHEFYLGKLEISRPKNKIEPMMAKKIRIHLLTCIVFRVAI